MKTINLTAMDAEEVLHKVCVLCDTPDLQEDYRITQQQADTLADSIPRNGGEWAVPEWATEVVRGELADHALVLRHMSHDQRRNCRTGEALTLARQAIRMEAIAES